jgi:Flp pilus assembly protein TadD
MEEEHPTKHSGLCEWTFMEQQDRQTARFRQLRAASDSDLPALTIARARRYLKDYPDHGPAWMLLGIALNEVTHFEKARRALKKALKLCPPEKRRIPLAQMGHHFEFRRRFKRAVVWYQKAIDAAPEHASSYIFLGGILAREGRLDEAEAVHRAATMCQEGCLDEAFLNLGLVLRAQGRLVEAVECFVHALHLDPDDRAAKKALRDVRRTIKYLRRS